MTEGPPTDHCSHCKIEIWGGRFSVIVYASHHFCSDKCKAEYNWVVNVLAIKSKAVMP